MHDHVVQQGLPRDEALVADGAREQLLPGVEPHVQVEDPLPLERLPAVVARKVVLFCLFLLQRKLLCASFILISIYKQDILDNMTSLGFCKSVRATNKFLIVSFRLENEWQKSPSGGKFEG